MEINFIEFIKPELLVLVPVAYLLGIGLKKSAYFADEKIPIVLGLSSVILSALYVVGTSSIANYQECVLAIFTALTQGILTAGASVYINQLIKQQGKSGGQ